MNRVIAHRRSSSGLRSTTLLSPCGESAQFPVYGLNFLCVRKKKKPCVVSSACIAHHQAPLAIHDTMPREHWSWLAGPGGDMSAMIGGARGEIGFLLVVMKGPAGEHGWDNISIKTEEDTHTHTHTHTRPIYLIYHNTHNLLHWSQRPQRHYTFSNVENNKEEPDCRILSGPGGESRRDRRNSQTIKLWGKGSSVSLENVRKVQLEQLREKCEGEHVATNDIELTDQSEHVLD